MQDFPIPIAETLYLIFFTGFSNPRISALTACWGAKVSETLFPSTKRT
jgi:hypothetical protein